MFILAGDISQCAAAVCLYCAVDAPISGGGIKISMPGVVDCQAQNFLIYFIVMTTVIKRTEAASEQPVFRSVLDN